MDSGSSRNRMRSSFADIFEEIPFKKEPVGLFLGHTSDIKSTEASMYQSFNDEYEEDFMAVDPPKRKLSPATLAASDAKYDLSDSVDQLDVAEKEKTRKRQKPVEKTPDLILEDANHVNIKAEETVVNLPKSSERIQTKDLVVLDTVLGEGQVGMVHLAKYKNLLVACKNKRTRTKHETFYLQIESELKFAAKLSMCRNINRYIGWIYCERKQVELDPKGRCDQMKLYVLQRYVANGDARSYLDKRESTFQPAEVLKASICLFSALTDAHALGIGIVDLKLENFLIDSSGAGWLTDFGSCIEFDKSEEVDLEAEEVAWTTSVASPEMIKLRRFSKASDVFMATLIIAELITAELNDDEFHDLILQRKTNGSVEFSSNNIHRRYDVFFELLRMGLANDPDDRPSAKTTLSYLLQMKYV